MCTIYTQNIKKIKLETEKKELETKNTQLKETLKLLQQLEEIYKEYLNK